MALQQRLVAELRARLLSLLDYHSHVMIAARIFHVLPCWVCEIRIYEYVSERVEGLTVPSSVLLLSLLVGTFLLLNSAWLRAAGW